MIDFFRAGGFSMFILLAMGLVLVPYGVLFAKSADPQRLSLIRALTKALVFASIVGFLTNLAATAKGVVYIIEHEPKENPLVYLLGGFAESCAAPILGGGLAVITWILVAVGVRRMPSDLS